MSVKFFTTQITCKLGKDYLEKFPTISDIY